MVRRLAFCLGGGMREAPRSGSGRPSLLFEHAGHDGQVLLAQTLLNGLLPFVSQAGKDGEPVAAGRLRGQGARP